MHQKETVESNCYNNLAGWSHEKAENESQDQNFNNEQRISIISFKVDQEGVEIFKDQDSLKAINLDIQPNSPPENIEILRYSETLRRYKKAFKKSTKFEN